VSAREVFADAATSIGGNCETEAFHSNGKLFVGGLLNADTVDLCLCTPEESTIGSIGCTDLTVSLGKRSSRTNETPGILKVGTIEGDNLTLIYTEAETVRGTNVIIGPGCKIGAVEYYGNCEISPDATVDQCTKL
jgi:cytoskeletal protein CcmA (bactofilin family)